MAGEIQLNSVTLATESGGVASIDSSVNIKGPLNASGSAPIYACRAWVNFNGTGTVAIRASGNVSSITDNGTSDYTVNFTTAMPDADYAAFMDGTNSSSGTANFKILASAANSAPTLMSTSQLRIYFDPSADVNVATVAIFR